MRRREFIALLSGAAIAWPLKAHGQQKATPVIGFLASTSPQEWATFVKAFRQGLSAAGYVEGRNVAIEYRWAENQYNRLPALAVELVRQEVAVIVASGGDVSAHAARAATSTISIVSTFGGDPVRSGLVASLNHPGGNVTGVSLFNLPLEAKRLELIHEFLPHVRVLAQLINPRNPNADLEEKEVATAASALGLRVHVLRAGDEGQFSKAYEDIIRLNARALLVSSDPSFIIRADVLVALSARYAIPTIYYRREFVDLGGLISYGSRYPDAYRQVGIYAGKILAGTKAADLSVAQPTRFELVLNFKTASGLGLTIPPGLLLRADEVVE